MTNGIRNLKISFKLYILVGVALIGMLIIGGMSFFLLNRMNDKTSDITSSWLPSVDVAREMDTTISNVRLNELAYLTADYSQPGDARWARDFPSCKAQKRSPAFMAYKFL